MSQRAPSLSLPPVPSACRFAVAPVFSLEDFRHWMLPRDGVIYTYVVADADTHEVSDLTSFYSLPSTVVQHPVHNRLSAAYSYYNCATSATLKTLMNDALILAHNVGPEGKPSLARAILFSLVGEGRRLCCASAAVARPSLTLAPHGRKRPRRPALTCTTAWT